MRFRSLNVPLLAVIAVLAGASTACSDFIRQDRSPVTLIIDRLEAAPGEESTFDGLLLSDVRTDSSVFNDTGRVTMRLIMKDVGTAPSPVNSVTINRYRVRYVRADGRNTPGVDVPYAFDSGVTFTVPASGGTVAHLFDLTRHVAKVEAPLGALAGSFVIISTIAEVTFFGHDQAGNELSVSGNIGVNFGDFADPN